MRLVTACPKCQTERLPNARACPRCGLSVDRWEGFIVAAPSHPLLDRLWEEVVGHWENDQAHARFLDGAASAGGLDLAAARYRIARKQRPGDGRAEAGLRRALSLAENLHHIHAHNTRPRAVGAWFRVVGYLAGGFIVLVAAAGIWMLVRGR
jgi:hypothetical protein